MIILRSMIQIKYTVNYYLGVSVRTIQLSGQTAHSPYYSNRRVLSPHDFDDAIDQQELAHARLDATIQRFLFHGHFKVTGCKVSTR